MDVQKERIYRRATEKGDRKVDTRHKSSVLVILDKNETMEEKTHGNDGKISS